MVAPEKSTNRILSIFTLVFLYSPSPTSQQQSQSFANANSAFSFKSRKIASFSVSNHSGVYLADKTFGVLFTATFVITRLALGERESGTGKLTEAVAAYRAALEEYTRARVPLEWARTQMNLGTAIVRLGERESGTGKLTEAVAAFRAALEERTRARVPHSSEQAQN
jgi:tetratricopeptide (TPR) repeat protein